MSRRHLGSFPDFDALWKKFPAGGLAGDSVTVDDTDYDWDEVHKQWKDPEDTGARITETVDGDLDVHNDLRVGGKIKKEGYDDSYALLAGGGVLPLADIIIDEEDIDEQTVNKYLSKIRDDIARGKITFAKGLVSLMTAFFGSFKRKASGDDTDTGASISPDGTGDFVNLIVRGMVKGSLTVEELLSIKDMLFTGTIRSKDAQGREARKGFQDGYGIFMDAAEGLIEADGMNIRGFLRVMELVINRLQLMESDYSFTEGGTVEHVDITADGERMVFWMHKKHDNDLTPFYYGDIIYAKVNDLLSHGSYYTCWYRVVDVNFEDNTLTVVPYVGRDGGGAVVPGGTNFTPKGLAISTDYIPVLLQERQSYPDGYDTQMNVTRHGNVADGIDPSTGMVDQHIMESQKGRQQAWVLSTTDKRLTFFWNVDQPIIREDNYSLCLGILPDLSVLPSTRDKSMPSLYINTLFYEHMHHIHYPARIIKEDRGAWTLHPMVVYTGPTGEYVPDGTLDDALITGWAGAYTQGAQMEEPYHFEHLTKNTWLTYRLSSAYANLSDNDLYDKMMVEWHLDRETSRAWNGSKLWECLVEATTEEPVWNCSDWRYIAGDTEYWIDFTSSNGSSFYQGHVQTTVTARIYWGTQDVTDKVGTAAFRWTRSAESGKTAADESWDAQAGHIGTNVLALTDADMPTAWSRNNKAIFTCSVTVGGNVLAENEVIA